MRPSSCCKGLQINRPIGIETAARSSRKGVSAYATADLTSTIDVFEQYGARFLTTEEIHA
jgi:hypothetical protein